MSALPAPAPSGLATAWTLQPLALAAVVALAAWYVRAALRTPRWPRRRTLTFALGLLLLAYATCGFPGAYLTSLFWVWTVQQLALLLVVPLVILAGGPLRLLASDSPISRVLRSRVALLLSSPLVGPALVPLLSVALFFGPLPRWAVDIPVLGWIEQLVLLAIGAFIVLPLVGTDEAPSSLRVGLGLAIGSFELVLDAVPGIALRLHNSLATSYFDVRSVHDWSPSALHDQQLAGSILWSVAELLDLPFLVLVFVKWIRADARDAAQVDAVLEAERAARSESEQDRDTPWWLSDPTLKDRLR